MIQSVHTLDTGFFKLDGGAMFGVVPKSMWNRLNPADENNMCTWALRCLLLKSADRKILIDCGMGNKQDEKFRSHFHPHGKGDLLNSLSKHDLKKQDITDVILTHLHFDHCGGAVEYDDNRNLVPTFPNARYWSNKTHWEWALKPNEREKNSFLKENFVPLQDQGVLKFVDDHKNYSEIIPGINFHFCSGHTEALMAIEIDCLNQNYFYPADLIPSSHHINIPYVMAYDVQPLLTLREKKIHLQRCLEKNSIIIFEHDPKIEACTLKSDERGRIVIDQEKDFN